MAQFFLSAFGFPCPLLSTHVICPFHQTHPHSVIKGHLGIISFLNLAFGGISCSRSLFIFMSVNCWAPSNPKQTGRPAFPLVALSQTVYSPPVTLLLPPKPLHNTTYKNTNTHKRTNQLPLSPGCPGLPSVHLREDTQCDPSPPKRLIKLRCATAFQTTLSYPLSLWLNHGVKKGSTQTLPYLQTDQTCFGV